VAHAVPLFPQRDVLDAEIGRQVDDLDTGFEQFRRLLHGDAVGGGEEHHVALVQRRILGVAEVQADETAQAGKHVGDRLAGVAARGDGRQFDPGCPASRRSSSTPV
jgi:hypothetical protein